MKPVYRPKLKVVTVHMKRPLPLAGHLTQRATANGSEPDGYAAAKEDFLRRSAYKNTTLKIDESFFDDTDMSNDYFLVVVYDQSSGTPLLSARYYFDLAVITKYLSGDPAHHAENVLHTLHLEDPDRGKLLLADRLSGHVSHALYRQERASIFSMLYAEILKNNQDSHLLLMVRKDKNHKQISRYLNMGFEVMGSTCHKGKTHVIIHIDLKKVTK